MAQKNSSRVDAAASHSTPLHIVRLMCDRAEPQLSQLSCKVLDPGCGTGNFLAEILARRLLVATSDAEILLGLSNLYGIDILPRCVRQTRNRLAHIIRTQLGARPVDYRFWPQCEQILQHNFLCGDLRSGLCGDLRGNLCGDLRSDWRGDPCNYRHGNLRGDQPIILVNWQPCGDFCFQAHPTTLAACLAEAK